MEQSGEGNAEEFRDAPGALDKADVLYAKDDQGPHDGRGQDIAQITDRFGYAVFTAEEKKWDIADEQGHPCGNPDDQQWFSSIQGLRLPVSS